MNDIATKDSVYEGLTEIFRNVFEDESIVLGDAMTAADVDRWDSLNHINIVIAAEQKFGIKFKTSEVASFANVGDFVNGILKKISTKGS